MSPARPHPRLGAAAIAAVLVVVIDLTRLALAPPDGGSVAGMFAGGVAMLAGAEYVAARRRILAAMRLAGAAVILASLVLMVASG